MELVDLAEVIPGIVVDLRYATANNFLGRPIYTDRRALLRPHVAEKLAKVPIRLVVFDAYRPPEAQRLMWELKPDPRYVADPARGSRHSRGLAVDCGIAGADMGTDFDDFSERSAHSFKDLPTDVLARRALLKAEMEKAGFSAYDAEWWHYSIPD